MPLNTETEPKAKIRFYFLFQAYYILLKEMMHLNF